MILRPSDRQFEYPSTFFRSPSFPASWTIPSISISLHTLLTPFYLFFSSFSFFLFPLSRRNRFPSHIREYSFLCCLVELVVVASFDSSLFFPVAVPSSARPQRLAPPPPTAFLGHPP